LAAATRKRHDPRRDATRVALIDAAESLFADAGVEGVSTRQIGAAIGSSNTNVVAYHFGSKEALLEAVCRHRLPDIDRRRRELLDEADAAGTSGDLRELVRIFALPLHEQVDTRGRHSFARFLAGLERSGMIAARGLLVPDFPETERLIERMAHLLPFDTTLAVQQRLRLVTGLMIAALQIIDLEMKRGSAEAQDVFDNAVCMAAAAMAAPPYRN
jgi:AcrR family transcriptional regulator